MAALVNSVRLQEKKAPLTGLAMRALLRDRENCTWPADGVEIAKPIGGLPHVPTLVAAALELP